MSAVPVARPWRGFLRFSVRGLIVLVLVVGAWLGWLVRSARIQREAVAAIKAADGGVFYDWEWSNGVSILGGKPWSPRWLVDLIGIDYSGHVAFVGLVSSSPATDAAIRQLGCLTRLDELNLQHSSVNDVSLAGVEGLTHLSRLHLDYTDVSDAGLAHLKGLTYLSLLNINATRVTDAGLAHLRRHTELSKLYLNGTQVTDGGLVHLDLSQA